MGRKVPFENDEHYHVFNRGVEKRKIFLDEEDYSYFTFILNLFNTEEPAINARFHYRGRTSIIKPNDKLVEIVSYCLLPNHYHFLLRQASDNGASKFLQKVMTGYTMYFNKKYKRSGALFQGKTKSNHIDTDKYLKYLKMYIELNPLDLFEKNWKQNGVRNKLKAKEFLESYKWKSKFVKNAVSLYIGVTDDDFRGYIQSLNY